MELLIKGGRIVDCSQDFKGDIYIRDGIIAEIGENLIKNCCSISGEGLTVLPSFIDLHSHFRDPGLTEKEDIISGSKAAVKGGYTGVNLMANTKPICSDMEIVDYVLEKARKCALIDIHQTVSITRELQGVDISHLNGLKERVRLLSDDGKGVQNSRVMLEAMVKAKEMGMKIISHAENEELIQVSSRLAENIMTWRDICLAKFTGCKLHMAHVSTKEAMEYIMEAKKRGQDVTCEVTPHHIGLTDEIQYRVNPPLRDKEDVEFLIEAIRNGYVDAIATDHAPHREEDKKAGAPGMVGLETSFSVCYTELVKRRGVSLNKLSELMSKNPAKIIGFNKGEIKIGFEGDLVLVDTTGKYEVQPEKFLSKGKNTAFIGREYDGVVKFTIKAGKIVYKAD